MPNRSSDYAPWRQATGPCAKAAQPGARALMAVIVARFPGTTSWGILSCRNTALGNQSAHAKGRALDVGCSLQVGHRLVKAIRKIGPRRLGISVIIHDRVMYSAKSPNGRRYTGVPHRDHVHLEMTGKAAKRLNVATIRRILAS